MMRPLLLLCCLLSSGLTAQDDLLRQIADSTCACLVAADVPLEQTSLRCLRDAALRHRQTLLVAYQLDVADSRQRASFAADITDLLIDRCPLLETYRPAGRSREIRWSDRPEASSRREPPAYVSERRTPPPPSSVVREVSGAQRLSGQLLARPGARGLRLRTATGEERRFEMTAAAARKRDFRAGEPVSVVFRREWRPGEGRIVDVVTAFEN